MHTKRVFINFFTHSYKFIRLSSSKCLHSAENHRQPLESFTTGTIGYVPLTFPRVVCMSKKPNYYHARCSSNQSIAPDFDKEDARKSTNTNLANVENKTSVESDSHDLFDSIDYELITGKDPECLNKLKLLILEVDVLRQDGMNVPKYLSTEQWLELLSLTTKSQRGKFLNFLWLNEIREMSDNRKKERKRLEFLERKKLQNIEDEKNNHIIYGFRGNTIFLRVYDTTINLFDNSRLVQAMQFSQTVIIDCGFCKDMSLFENKLTAKQLCYVFAENRLHRDPLNLHFCNLNKDDVLFKQFKKYIPTMEDAAFPMNLSQESYLDLYPKEKIVYLTPHCRTELKEYSHDDIYVVGALVDKQNQQPLTLAKAKSEGIRMAHLPIDRFLKWHIGTKSLTINQVLAILVDMRFFGDWSIALRHVPKRKLCDPSKPFEDHRKVKRRGTILQPPKYWKGG